MNRPSGARSWVLRSFRAGDEEGVARLFRIVFRRSAPDGYWEWKLRSCPLKNENEWIVESCGEIVGHYAVTPIRFKLLGRQVLVPHGCDAMTHPDYRRQGILTALGRRANEVWKAAGAPFQIGFHYGGWGSVRETLGWQAVVRLVWLKRWIRPFFTVARKFRIPGERAWSDADAIFNHFIERRNIETKSYLDRNEVRLERLSRPDDRLDQLWEKLSPKYGMLAIRDRAWVRWRYFDMPGAQQFVILAMRENEPLGYIAIRVVPAATPVRASIVDLFVDPADTDTATALVDQAVGSASQLGARSLASLAAVDSDLLHRLRRAGFWRGQHGFDFSIIPYASSRPDWASGDWYVTGAEGDVL